MEFSINCKPYIYQTNKKTSPPSPTKKPQKNKKQKNKKKQQKTNNNNNKQTNNKKKKTIFYYTVKHFYNADTSPQTSVLANQFPCVADLSWIITIPIKREEWSIYKVM